MSINEINTSSTYTFNYTLIEELYGSEYNLSPRFTSDAYLERFGSRVNKHRYQMFIDFEREAEIGIGVDWPFPDLKEDECIVSDEIKDHFNLAVDELLTLYTPYK